MEKLKEKLKTDKTTEAVLHALALRQRERKEPLDLTRFLHYLRREGFVIDIKSYYETFREIERVKWGQFKSPSKFEWLKPIKTLCSMLFTDIAPTHLKVVPEEPSSDVVFVLNDKMVKVELPQGLTLGSFLTQIRKIK